jgi:hypothetical protein
LSIWTGGADESDGRSRRAPQENQKISDVLNREAGKEKTDENFRPEKRSSIRFDV